MARSFRSVQNLGLGIYLTLIAVFLAGLVGWVMNIIDLVGMSFAGNEGLFVLRVIGIFVAPLGGVLGYF